MPPYPLFREPQYLLALANTIARVAEERRLDIVHAHYAVPHATAAYLADQMLDDRAPRPASRRRGRSRRCTAPTSRWSAAIPSYARVVAFSIEQSHGVTAVSREPEGGHDQRARHPARDPRHPQLPRLRGVSPPRRSRAARAAVPAGSMRRARRARVELPAGQARRRGARGLPPDPPAACARGSCSIGDGPVRADIERRVADYGLDRRRRRSSASSTIWCRGSRSPICSCCRRRRRASASRRSRRWRARCRWSRRRSAGCPRSSRTASPASSARRTRSRRWPSAASRC